MPERASQQDLDDRIALARRNIEDLTEQATATSGSGAEEAIADRISEQQAALDELLRAIPSLIESNGIPDGLRM